MRGARSILFATVLWLVGGTAAAGQDEPADTLDPVALRPVVVTVLRTPLALRTVPYAVAVREEAAIQRGRPGLALDEALRGVAGVQVDNRYNYALGERISIRGFGARAQFGVRGIRVLVDGIPATMPDGQTTLSHVHLGSLGRVEVVRGPASAVYGNTAGGVIQLQSAPPPSSPLHQQVEVVSGDHGLLRLSSSTGGRAGDAFYRVNLARLTYGGYREHSRAENVHVNATLGYRSALGDLRLAVHAVDYDALNPGTLSDSLLRVDRTMAFANNVRQKTGEVGRHGQLGLTWRGEAAGGDFEVAAYGVRREIDNPIPNAIVDLERGAGGVRALYRTRPSDGLALRWALAAELDGQRDERRNFRNRLGERGDLTLDQREEVSNLGLSTQLSSEPHPGVSVLGGVRYDRTRFRASDRLITDRNPDDSGERTLDALSPSVGIGYTLAPELGVYANVATSFETPTTTELANRPSGAGGFNPELEPQRTVSYEVGARGELGGRASYVLAAYTADIRNSLIPFEVPDLAGRQFFRNAGSSRHRGAEATLLWRPLPGLQAELAYTFIQARFREYRTPQAVRDGNEVPGIAPHRVEGIVTYERPGGWYATVETRHVSSMPVDDANSAYSPAYSVTDLRAGHQAVRIGGVRIAPFAGVGNLFDAEYNTSVVVNAFGGRFFEPGPARTLFFGVRVGAGR